MTAVSHRTWQIKNVHEHDDLFCFMLDFKDHVSLGNGLIYNILQVFKDGFNSISNFQRGDVPWSLS